jgi:hypothetical protein
MRSFPASDIDESFSAGTLSLKLVTHGEGYPGDCWNRLILNIVKKKPPQEAA